MITTFENSHNMMRVDRPMVCQTVSRGLILPRRDVEQGPMWGLGGVCDEHNRFVELSAYDGGWASQGGFYDWTDEDYCDDNVVYFGVFFNHWGHFLIDLLGRLWPFADPSNPCKGWKLAYLGDEEPKGNFLEFLSLLGIEKEQLIHVTTPTRFRNVMVPEFCCKSCKWYSDEYRGIFDAMVAQVEQEVYVPERIADYEKVYLTRNAFGKAKGTEFGEDMIVRWMEANGFTVLAPETLSVREQIYLWNHAREIACLDGSIPMNVAFSRNRELKLSVFHKTHLEHLNLELYLLMRPCDVHLLDVWYEPLKKYPKNIGAGPFIFHLGEDAKTYSAQRGWVFPFAEKELEKQKKKNVCRMVWHIINIKGRARMLLSRLVPTSLKKWMRRIRGYGDV